METTARRAVTRHVTNAMRRLAALVFVSASVTVPAVLVTAAPAHASCPVEVDYSITAIEGAWLGTSAFSYWTEGPTTIDLTESEAASASYAVSANFSVNVGTVVQAGVAEGYSVTTSTTKTQSWTYHVSIPSGVQARARVYKQALGMFFNKYTTNPNCTVTTQSGELFAPYSSNANQFYCICRDSYPGYAVLRSSTTCFNH